jgi:hypothetical protein
MKFHKKIIFTVIISLIFICQTHFVLAQAQGEKLLSFKGMVKDVAENTMPMQLAVTYIITLAEYPDKAFRVNPGEAVTNIKMFKDSSPEAVGKEIMKLKGYKVKIDCEDAKTWRIIPEPTRREIGIYPVKNIEFTK